MDDAQALHWYGQAADQGHAEAQYNLGVMNANGWGVEMSTEAAITYYRPAAETGFVPALTALADLCHRGMGIEQNIVEAYILYAVAARLGDFNSEFKRDEVAGELTDDEIAGAQQQVQERLATIDVESMQVGEFD